MTEHSRARRILALVSSERKKSELQENKCSQRQRNYDICCNGQDENDANGEKFDSHLHLQLETKGTTSCEQEQAISGYRKISEQVPIQGINDYELTSPKNLQTSECTKFLVSDETTPPEKHGRPVAYVTPIKHIFGSTTELVEEPYYIPTTSEDTAQNRQRESDFSDSESDYVPSESNSDSSVEDNSRSRKNNFGLSTINSHLSSATDAPSSEVTGSEADNSSMIVRAAKTNEGKRIRDKRHACYFCHKLLLNMARHFEVIHGQDIEVCKILALPSNSKQRKEEWSALIKAGDFYHNTEVLASKTGELILVRRPSEEELKTVTYSDYSPCPKCLGFFFTKQLWHHLKYNCKKATDKDEDCTNRNYCLVESKSILNGILSKEFPIGFHSNIFDKLVNDPVAVICKNDDLILRFGLFLYEKYGDTQHEYIRQSMRQLGRFMLELRKVDNVESLDAVLAPEKFDSVIQATKQLCIISQEGIVNRPQFKIPSLALKIGYALKKCIGIERGKALRSGNLRKDKNLSSFLMLIELEWNTKISSNALATLNRRKLNSKELLPLTSDLVALGRFLNDEMKYTLSSLRNHATLPLWTKLASLTLSRIVLFNKRRSGEASKITIEQYNSRPHWNDSETEAIQQCLTPFEKQLAKSLVLVEIIGKRGQKVPVLLTEEMKESIDLLINSRPLCGITQDNPYIFAAGGGSNGHIRGHDALRKWCVEAKLTSPELVTGTKLRKYVATVCQVFNLTENQQDWVARHLGHNIMVHRNFYRLHENAVELAKVSRLLIAIDEGSAKKFAGKSLEEIGVDDIQEIEEENDVSEEEPICSDIQTLSPFRSDKLDEEGGSGESRRLNRRRSSRRKQWSAEEVETVLHNFRVQIKNDNLPGKADCEKLMKEHPEKFQDRKWTDIKFYVKNHITKVNKLKEKSPLQIRKKHK